jgi:very-short-patch-repair endonuclease
MRITDPKLIKALLKSGKIKESDKKFVTDSLSKQAIARRGESSEEILYQLLLPKYGDFFKGDGHLVKELRPIFTRKYRLDLSMPKLLINIDVDGLAGHSILANGQVNITGFKRDRERDMLLTAQGWHVIRCMRSHIKDKPELILNAVEFLVKTRTEKPVNISLEHGAYPVIVKD